MTKIEFNPQGAFLTSWKIGKQEVLYQGSETKRGGIPLLFPFYGTWKKLPQHGFGRLSRWLVVKQSPSHIIASLSNHDLSNEFESLYHYQFKSTLDIRCRGNSLSYRLIVKNTGDVDLPLAPALHPYWPISHQDKAKVTVHPKIFDPKVIDWDSSPPDTGFEFSAPFQAFFPNYLLTIADPSHVFNRLQLWSQKTSMPDFNFICIEPLTSPHLIEPDETKEYFIQFTVSLF